MDGADGNRKLWLLQSTANEIRPERLAAAIALGVLAGLVPKLNLLAVLLYGTILLLPIPTLLAVVVSAIVAVLSWRLDGVADTLGELLLRNEALRSTWLSLEQLPLVPWLALHNTVVVGHLAIGIVLLAPTYVISCRVLERLSVGRVVSSHESRAAENYAPVPADEDELVSTGHKQRDRSTIVPDRNRRDMPQSPDERSPLIIPPPKLNRHTEQTIEMARVSGPDEPVVFEPVGESSNDPSVNSWHMRRGVGNRQAITVDSDSGRQSKKQSVQKPNIKPGSNPDYNLSDSAGLGSDLVAIAPGMIAAAAEPSGSVDHSVDHSDDKKKRPAVESSPAVSGQSKAMVPLIQASSGTVMDSLQLAQSASEVLAWVDDLLDECLAEEGMACMANISTGRGAVMMPAAGSRGDIGAELSGAELSGAELSGAELSGAELSGSSDPAEPSWLLETTIEIVRLSDEAISTALLMSESALAVEADTSATETRSIENSKVMTTESMMRAWPRVGGASTASDAMSSTDSSGAPMVDSGEPTILSLNQTARGSHDKRMNAGFQQLVMAGVQKVSESGATATSSGAPVEPVKGECLAYLLGHLRQSREGKST